MESKHVYERGSSWGGRDNDIVVSKRHGHDDDYILCEVMYIYQRNGRLRGFSLPPEIRTEISAYSLRECRVLTLPHISPPPPLYGYICT